MGLHELHSCPLYNSVVRGRDKGMRRGRHQTNEKASRSFGASCATIVGSGCERYGGCECPAGAHEIAWPRQKESCRTEIALRVSASTDWPPANPPTFIGWRRWLGAGRAAVCRAAALVFRHIPSRWGHRVHVVRGSPEVCQGIPARFWLSSKSLSGRTADSVPRLLHSKCCSQKYRCEKVTRHLQIFLCLISIWKPSRRPPTPHRLRVWRRFPVHGT